MTDTRLHARQIIQDRLRRCDEEVEALRILDKAIDWDALDDDQERKLWNLFVRKLL